MATYAWRTTPDGYVEVDKGTGTYERIFETVEGNTKNVKQWVDLAIQKSLKYGVPAHWILGVITAETRGKPGISGMSKIGLCVGLMMICLSAHNQTAAAMQDPDQNLDYGTSLLAKSVKLGFDLPQTASAHNAGYDPATKLPWPSAKSPWGIREESPYIENVVKGANYFLRYLETYVPSQEPALPPPMGRSTAEVLIMMAVGFGIGYLSIDALRTLVDRHIRKTSRVKT